MLYYRLYICNGSRNIWIDKHEPRRINILKNRYYSKYHYWTKYLKSSAFKLSIARNVVAILVCEKSNDLIRPTLKYVAMLWVLTLKSINWQCGQIEILSKDCAFTYQRQYTIPPPPNIYIYIYWTLEISQLSFQHDLFFSGPIVLNLAKHMM